MSASTSATSDQPLGFSSSEIPPRLAAALADRYVLERELGRGGMATVYLAQDLRHHALGRAQGAASRPGSGAGAGALPSRNPDRRPAPARPHPAAVRLGHRRRAALLRHALHRGRVAPGPDDPGAAARPPRGAADQPGDRRRAGPRPCPGDRAPRHQAGEHPAHPGGECAGGRLRHRPGGRPPPGSRS